MSDTTEPTSSNETVPAQVEPKRITRLRVSQARLDRYIEVLEQTGSHMEASRLASAPNDVEPVSEKSGGTTPAPGYQTFYLERRTNSDFAARCAAAIDAFVGRAEAELARRMFLPTERASLTKDGSIAHISRDFRNADQLLLRALARHRPQEWSELARREVKNDTTVNVSHNSFGAPGAAYIISSEVIQLLDEHDRQLLGQLMVKAEEKRLELERQKEMKQLEAPKGNDHE